MNTQRRRELGPVTVWHVNSTAMGGGVAELLRSTIGAHERAGLSARWYVIDGDPEFFAITKVLHHRLHGSRGAGESLDGAARQKYEAVTERAASKFIQLIQPGDIAVLHDPQTLGMAKHLADAGVAVAWRLHIGTGHRNAQVDQAWEFLRPYLSQVSRCVLSLAAFAPEWLEQDRTVIIEPSIDPDTHKNRQLTADVVSEILAGIGVRGVPASATLPPEELDRIELISRVIHDDVLAELTPTIVQISRWDPLKDMAGVLRAFVEHVVPHTVAHLVLAGPDPADIPDDPEGAEIFSEIVAARTALEPEVRARVHLVVLSLKDAEANALAVNALQSRAEVIVQHSLREGFGLTVTEAMWKSRPIVASGIDGIARQIEHGVHGLLTTDPTDLAELGDSMRKLLTDLDLAVRLGAAARERCGQEFLLPRETADYFSLYGSLVG